MNYEFKTEPYAHQRAILEKSAHIPGYALFWEMGTGKSKAVCDTAALLYERGEIDGVLVIAPPNVHTKWAQKEVCVHVPDRVKPRAFAYETSRSKNVSHKAALAKLTDGPGLPFLCMSYPALITNSGFAAAEAFLKTGKRLLVIDESRKIKTASAERTKRVFKLGKLVKWKRILSGTPVANGPFDVYGPIKFLSTDFWKGHGLGTLASFQSYFGVFVTGYAPGGRTFPQKVGYKRLSELQEILAPISDRILSEDAVDLPAKTYDRITFEITAEQRRHYDNIEDFFVTKMESGEEVTANIALARTLRQQQVICGYLPDGDGNPVVDLPGGNPRLTALLEFLEDVPHKTIIFARFVRDIDLICKALGKDCVRYDGSVSGLEQMEAIRRFQEEDVQFFVGNPDACGEGHDLYKARVVIYYSNTYDLDKRQQSEKRAHRIGQLFPVLYIDLEASNTVDEVICDALRKKIKVSDAIMGDRERTHL